MAWPTNLRAKIPFIHEGSKSSSGKQTTTGANQEFDFSATPLNSLEITAHADDIHIKLNDETNTHLVQSGGSITIDGLNITKLTIVENGVEYSYSGMYWVS
jgi:hypothetical protein